MALKSGDQVIYTSGTGKRYQFLCYDPDNPGIMIVRSINNVYITSPTNLMEKIDE